MAQYPLFTEEFDRTKTVCIYGKMHKAYELIPVSRRNKIISKLSVLIRSYIERGYRNFIVAQPNTLSLFFSDVFIELRAEFDYDRLNFVYLFFDSPVREEEVMVIETLAPDNTYEVCFDGVHPDVGIPIAFALVSAVQLWWVDGEDITDCRYFEFLKTAHPEDEYINLYEKLSDI